MFTVYVLRDSEGKLYKGVTNNLSRRLNEHKNGHTRSTRYMDDINVVYTEEYPDWEVARKREVYFKSAAGRRFLKKVINLPM
ncbi:GIY-YIG nuclease family protein [Candidatus Parcubacteria bacterium]|nr:GIY-YIG nuclease family protein [Candidatus Parcubacteria bacterium]